MGLLLGRDGDAGRSMGGVVLGFAWLAGPGMAMTAVLLSPVGGAVGPFSVISIQFNSKSSKFSHEKLVITVWNSASNQPKMMMF